MMPAIRYSHTLRVAGRTVAVFTVVRRSLRRLPKTGWADVMMENLSKPRPGARDTAAAAGFKLRGHYGTGTF